MNNRYFITSRKGYIRRISIYKYSFTPELINQSQQMKNFCSWLRKNPEIILHNLQETFFTTYLPLEEETWQYNFSGIEKTEPPFDNTSLISCYIGELCRNSYKKQFRQFFKENTFIIDKIELSQFNLLKCFHFNIEVFTDGEFFIHYSPISKIISSTKVTKDLIINLQNENQSNSNTDYMKFNLVENKHYKRFRFDLLDKKCAEQVGNYLDGHESLTATFDYHFMANFSPEIFRIITENTIKKLTSSVEFLIPISNFLELPESIDLHDKPFFQIDIDPLANRNNLLIGGNKKVKEQKAAFYNGIYQPAINGVIQPVSIDGYKTSALSKLLDIFNQGGNIQIFDPIEFSSDESIEVEPFKQLKQKYKSQLLVIIFTQYQQPRDFFEPLFKIGIRIQIFQGQADKFKLSNFVIKCLEKLGGILNVIDNTFEPETTYFLGIDLGHTTHNNEKYSNMCTVLFDYKGIQIGYKVIEKIPRNEAIDPIALGQAISFLEQILKRKKLPTPMKIIIHRDGKVHKKDLESFQRVLKDVLKVNVVDVIEIIKSGYPIIAAYDGNEYQNLESGFSWQIPEKRYAILVTNIQADEQGVILSPLILKHKFGNSDFSKVVEQVFWFTKIYTNNLYNSTRLPATTEKANNLVGTGDKRHISTYMA